MKKTLFFVVLFATLSIGFSQKLLQDEFHNRNTENWYNRKIGSSLWFYKIVTGAPQESIDFAKTQLPDMEAEFILALGYAHVGEADSAIFYANQSLSHGIPLARYLAGSLEAMQPLLALEGFQEIIKENDPGIIHGPLVGNVTESSAKIWVRTHQSQGVTIEISTDPIFKKINKTIQGKTSNEKENTFTFDVSNLNPATTYHYRATAENGFCKKGSFRTLGQNKFTIAFGGCSAYIPWREHMWSTIHSHQPDAFFTLGDNVYIDYPEAPQVQQYCYHQRQSNGHWQRFVANTPVYAIWDDHDFGDNDDFGLLEKYTPTWKYDNWKRFQNQWANPSYGGGDADPGVWFSKRMDDVEFFFLDARYYREPSYLGQKKDHPLTMLGPVQKAWLKRQLLASDATFKVIISSVPWAFPAKKGLDGKIDTWLGYPEERKEIFDFLTEKEIEGVFLLSSDRHRADLWEIDRDNDYTLYEMEVGRLTNTHRHPSMPGVTFSYNKKDAFGLLKFDLSSKNPSVRYEIWSIDNEKIFSHTINANELK